MTTTPIGSSLTGAGSQVESAKDSPKDAVTQGAADVASTAKDQAGSVVEATKQQGAEVAQSAKEHAQDLAKQTREQLRTQAQSQMQSIAETVQAIAGQLDGLANGEPQPGMALDVTKQLAATAHQVSERMDEHGMDGMLGDVKQFARRRPGVFLAASLVGGIVAGRVLRSGDMSEFVDTIKQSVSADTRGGSDNEAGERSEAQGASGQAQPAVAAVSPAAPASGYPLASGR